MSVKDPKKLPPINSHRIGHDKEPKEQKVQKNILAYSDQPLKNFLNLSNKYHSNNELTAEIFQRGIGWMDAGTVESLYEATETVRVLQRRQGLRFACPEEIAWRNGWIDKETLRESIAKFKNTEYGEYLDTFANKQKF